MQLLIKKTSIVLLVLCCINACTSIEGQRYMDHTPDFNLRDYFTGPVQAWGFIQDYSGNVTRRFDIDLFGTWEGDEGVLIEEFAYYDGETQRRELTLKDRGNGQYEISADDIVGIGQGTSYANALNLNYVMELPVDGDSMRVSLEDWIWAMNDGVVINRAYIRKFGIKVAEITLFMKKQ